MLVEAVAKVRLLFPWSALGDIGEADQGLPCCSSDWALGEATASANQLQPQQQHAHTVPGAEDTEDATWDTGTPLHKWQICPRYKAMPMRDVSLIITA